MKLLLIFVFIIAVYSAAEKSTDSLPYTFKAGDTIRASSVNATLNFLLAKINKTQAAVDSLGKLTTQLSDSLSRTKNSFKLPIGTIIASMLKPEDFKKQFTTDADNWKLADSSTANSEYFNVTGNANLPDLRGRFLRGMNEAIDSSKGDPDGNKRTVGSYQCDTVKNHNHNSGIFNNLLCATGFNTAPGFGTGNYPDILQRNTILPYGGAETRPRNVAVYWYIRVK
jgi:hypothetical protein